MSSSEQFFPGGRRYALIQLNATIFEFKPKKHNYTEQLDLKKKGFQRSALIFFFITVYIFQKSEMFLSLNNNNFNIIRSLGASFCLKLILISCWKIVWRPWNKNAILIQSIWCFGYIYHCHEVKKGISEHCTKDHWTPMLVWAKFCYKTISLHFTWN